MVSVEIKKQVEWYVENAAQQMKFANLAKCDEAMHEHSKNSFEYMKIARQINQNLAEKIYKKKMSGNREASINTNEANKTAIVKNNLI